ncbi:MAG: hypothetical protein Q9213_000328 [Squamulea squamosa]
MVFALLSTLVTGNMLYSLSCSTFSSYLMARASPTAHGSQVGSYVPSTSRCPRAKPTVTIASTITSGTSIIPTSPGFTPISSSNQGSTFGSSRSDFYSLTLTANAYGPDERGGNVPQTAVCGPVSFTTSATPSTCPVLPTVTTTTTVISPSSILYDACNADNLADTGYVSSKDRSDIRSLKLYNITTLAILGRIDVADCCAACQQLGCAYGYGLYTSFSAGPRCTLFFQDECNGKEWLGSVYSAGDPQSPVIDGFTVFNGPCGRIIDAGPEFAHSS